MDIVCPSIPEKVEEYVSKVLTQYRESPKLLQTLRDAMFELGTVSDILCRMPEFFDLDTAVGDQLTILGKHLGWPREHCRGRMLPVVGFDCSEEHPQGYCESYIPIAGMCDEDATWLDCPYPRFVPYTFEDDEFYRRFLYVRRYQFLGLYEYEDLLTSLRIIWGDTAWIPEFTQHTNVVVSPGRLLSNFEKALLPLYMEVLPKTPGTEIWVHLDLGPVAGFGMGWGGFCEGIDGRDPVLLNPQRVVD